MAGGLSVPCRPGLDRGAPPGPTTAPAGRSCGAGGLPPPSGLRPAADPAPGGRRPGLAEGAGGRRRRLAGSARDGRLAADGGRSDRGPDPGRRLLARASRVTGGAGHARRDRPGTRLGGPRLAGAEVRTFRDDPWMAGYDLYDQPHPLPLPPVSSRAATCGRSTPGSYRHRPGRSPPLHGRGHPLR